VRRAAIALTVAVTAAAFAGEAPAKPAVRPLRPAQQAQPAGYCTPASDDFAYLPRVVDALGANAPTTPPIAILDTGVAPDVPELAGRVLPGWDGPSGTPFAGDPDGHGTSVAGLAAGHGPGVLGVSPTSPILPVRIYTATGATTADAIAKSIALAVAKGAGVINLSVSGKLASTSPADQLKLTQAVDDAFSKGVLVVAAAGNDSESLPTIPAALPHVLVAGSSTLANTRSSFTNTGPWLDVLTPAEGVLAPLPHDLCSYGYGFSSGTSFAAPALSGAAAIVKALRPELTTQQQFEVVRRAAVDLGATGRDGDTGFGLLDVAAALKATPQGKETTPEVDDDPRWVRGPYAKAHPPLLTKAKQRFKALGSVSPAKDPADVYPVVLAKNERMVVSVNAADPAALLDLSILGPKAGDFDLTNGIDKNRLVSTGGLSKDPQVEITAKRAGTYYIAVEASDPIDPEDPSAAVPDLETYQVSAYKQHKKPKARKRKTR
jgi:hypothetical protein